MLFPATSSGLLSASATIYSGPCHLLGAQLVGDGTNAATLIVYDTDTGGAVSGKELCKVAIRAADDATISPVISFPVVANKGLYAVVSGTGAAFIVHYSLG